MHDGVFEERVQRHVPTRVDYMHQFVGSQNAWRNVTKDTLNDTRRVNVFNNV